jgi:nicotinamidase-related amidase
MQIKKRFTSSRTQLIVVDLQERLVPVINNSKNLLAHAKRLIHAATLVEIPTLSTVQYPRGLGNTMPELVNLLEQPPVEKLTFSAVGPEAVRHWLDPDKAVVLIGIETHVCIAQTAFDLIEMGFTVILPTDCVSARSNLDHSTAITRMAQAGVIPTTSEALLFEWIGSAEHPQFKAISKLVKEFRPEA